MPAYFSKNYNTYKIHYKDFSKTFQKKNGKDYYLLKLTNNLAENRKYRFYKEAFSLKIPNKNIQF